MFYSITDTTLNDLADSIRLKNNGEAETYTPREMIEKIIDLPYGNIPTYHYNEAQRVIKNILDFKTSHTNSIVFGAVSDSHIDIDNEIDGPLGKTSVRHASFALETVGIMAGCDFLVNLGGNCWENGMDTDKAYEGSVYSNNALRSAFSRLPSFRLIGVHDNSANTEKAYNLNGAYNEFDACGATKIRGFGYKDFINKKVRVICLNTTDLLNRSGDYAMSYEQKDFLMRALDLSSKSDAAKWQILILSHVPIDFKTSKYNFYADLTTILKAYIGGTIASIAIENEYITDEDPSTLATHSAGKLIYNYAGKNSAKIIGNIHGYTHNNSYGNMSDTKLLRMGTPNLNPLVNMTNPYQAYGDYSITSAEATALEKVENTARDTIATFYCIDLTEERIFAFSYGTGSNRITSYTIGGGGSNVDYYTIGYELTHINVRSSNTTIAKGAAYTNTISAEELYKIDSVKITMGGTNVTESVYDSSTGEINISNVTGNVVITATATLTVTNLIPTSTNGFAPTSGVFNECGYGLMEYEGETYYATGYILCDYGNTFYFANMDTDTNTIILGYRGGTLIGAITMEDNNIDTTGVNFDGDSMVVGRYGKAPYFYNINAFRVLTTHIDDDSIIYEDS